MAHIQWLRLRLVVEYGLLRLHSGNLIEIAIDWVLFIWKRNLTITSPLIVHWLVVILLPHLSDVLIKIKVFFEINNYKNNGSYLHKLYLHYS